MATQESTFIGLDTMEGCLYPIEKCIYGRLYTIEEKEQQKEDDKKDG